MKVTRFRLAAAVAATAASLLLNSAAALADTIPFALSGGNFSQDWTNVGLITSNDNWSGVPSITGHLGDDNSAGAADPQTVLAAGAGTIDVIANQTNPNTLTSGGVAEFDTLTNPVVAMQGSGTADNPYLMLYMNATGRTAVTISYLLRDVDGSADNAVQPFALQYRLATSGPFTNVPAGFVADASAGPSTAVLTTPVVATLPAWDNQAVLEFRILTTNAAGNDEWVGVDDIRVTSLPGGIIPEPATAALVMCGVLGLAMVRRNLA